MKKRRLGNDEDRDKITKLLKKESDGDRKERLIALKLGFSDQNKLNDIAKIVGRDRATVQRWFAHYRRKGLDSVLT